MCIKLCLVNENSGVGLHWKRARRGGGGGGGGGVLRQYACL